MMPTRFFVMTAPVDVLLVDGSFRPLGDVVRHPEPPIKSFTTFDDAERERATFGPAAAHLIVVEIEEA